jgi:dipeptidyl aminopeptidase/acylaminoacyl peptidase
MATKRPLQAEDLLALKLISEAPISPDGQRTCYVQTIFAPEKNEYRSHLWMIPTAGGEPAQFTHGEQLDFAPAWSPDGRRIAFLSTRSGSLQLWVIPTEGGEARQVTAVQGIAGRLVWSPDGRLIACTVMIGEEGLLPEELEEERLPPDKRYTQDVLRINTLPYKLNGVGYLGDQNAQLILVDPTGEAEPKVLTSGRVDYANPAWSPDGRQLALSMSKSQVAETPDPKRMFVGDIVVVPAEGGEMRTLTKSVGPAYAPAWSPDGSTIAYLGHARQYGDYTQPSVWTVSLRDSEPHDLTAAFDRPFGDQSIGDLLGHGEVSPVPVWAPDGQTIYYLVSNSGMTHLMRVEVPSGRVEPLTSGRRVIYNFSTDRKRKRFVLCHGDPLTPNDVFVLELVPLPREYRLTQVNAEFLSQVQLASPQRFSVESGDVLVEGWIMRPPGRGSDERTPTVLQVHGGPMVMYGYLFFFEFQLLATNGITVAYSNPRGSMGYGQAFVAAIRGDWGNKDFQDVMSAVEGAIDQGGIDSERIGIAGGSYGGFMVNWALGHSERFKTGVSMRSICSQYSFFGTSDFGFTDLAEYGGPPWQLADEYLARSPISFVEGVKAPLLLIHSENDLRTPLSEAEQFYTALKVLGREVLLRLYPNENHDLSRTGQPWHRVDRLGAILGWLGDHLGLASEKR